ncbi:prepilin-type N-terminal cleavage/methylation domain-containing protein [bacterium]|nr:prepilin-type N-terminal cleavage/methylation domain-containing protein [bacterium]
MIHLNKKSSGGFTLMELVITITIIALIMSIVLAAVRNSREKARIAKAQQFSQRINHIVGAYAIGIWRFESIEAGNRLIDNSGYSHYGVNHGANLNSAGIKGNCLEFDGVSDYVDIPNSSDMNAEGITIEAWIYPYDSSPLQLIVSKYSNTGDKDYGFGIHNGHLYIWYGSGGDYTNHLGTIKTYKWQHIALVFKGWDSYEAYIDGKLIGSDSGTFHQRASTTANVEIGRAGGSIGAHYFNGLIDEVKIYNQALPTVEIEKHYAQKIDHYKDLTLGVLNY